MFTVFMQTLRESLARRMGLVMIVLSVFIPLYFMYSLVIEQNPDGTYMVAAGRQKVPAAMFARFSWNAQLQFSQGLWMWIAIFVAGSLLSSYLEKGWADLLLTKGVARWKFLLARIAGCLTLFLLMIFMMSALPALYLWARTGISAKGFLLALLVVVFNYLCLLALMAMVSVPTPNVALLVMVGFLQIAFSNVLINRKEILEFFNKPWLEPVFNFIHGILPRTKEVSNMAADLMNNQAIESWSPLYWSAGLMVAYLAVACYSLHRKAI